MITIGRLSERSGVKVETIRYYERIGLMPVPMRSEGRHRLYGGDNVRRLVLIRRSRELGFSLDDIRDLLALGERGHSCGEIRQMSLAHAARIRDRIADLERMEWVARHRGAMRGRAGARLPDSRGPRQPRSMTQGSRLVELRKTRYTSARPELLGAIARR